MDAGSCSLKLTCPQRSIVSYQGLAPSGAKALSVPAEATTSEAPDTSINSRRFMDSSSIYMVAESHAYKA